MQVSSKRLLSLDVFRGATVAAMILVNNPGSWASIYPPLRHADWHGCTPTDLIFPFFLFIVGVSIAYAYGSSRLDRSRHGQLLLKALRRTLILFGLGLMLSLFPQVFTDPVAAFEVVRIPGVLQRIAVVFFISTMIFLKWKERSILWIGIGVLVFYWLLMTFVPVPGVGPANLGNETNLGAWLDRSLLGEAHLWKSVRTWDPEGILSTLPAVGSCLFGVLVGSYLRRKDVEAPVKVAWLCYYGVLALILGWLWSLQFPLNKSLWTSSFVLYTGGWATLTLALLYWIIDVQDRKRYTKVFLVFGVNAITVFFLSGIMARSMGLIKLGDGRSLKDGIYQAVFTPYFSAHNASIAYALVFVLFWTGIVWWMYNRKIFIKI